MSVLPVHDSYRSPPNFGHLLMVESEVPCALHIDLWLRFHETSLTHLAQTSHRFERQYLAWETVRKTRNPFFVEGTGFEGYFVGQNKSPEEVIELLLEIGHESLISNARIYHCDPHFKSVLMKTLTGEIDDDAAINVWATELGAMLGRLREHIYTNQAANQFQTETYRAVGNLPAIHYVPHEWGITQEFVLPVYAAGQYARLAWGPETVRPEDHDAALVVWMIGRFGHPLLRECVRESGTWAV